ncbi:tRNA 2-thiocytidine biosynthesis TtcA family protein [Fusobacterium sp. PH5-44]|uniref:tRNA 2-thiocytidine biosynthesis TtcA family protein n=1 Tax=unclassified Fusobacterium TaxID=2648384 RepID=UPI003D2505E3
MTKGQLAIENIKSTYRKKIWSKFINGIKEFSLIENGDRIAVGVSGGKDSLLLCKLFQILKLQKNIDFHVNFISMNPGFEKEDFVKFENNLKELDIPCEIFDANVWEVAFAKSPSNPCFLCAKMRRGVLYKKVEELGCNKLALGHHFDDIVETVMINMFYASTIKTMLPKVNSTSGNIQIIRPMVYVKEKDIINFTIKSEIEPMSCGCPVEGEKVDSKRKEIKNLLVDLEKNNKDIKLSIFNSIKNINLDYVMGYTRGNKKNKK